MIFGERPVLHGAAAAMREMLADRHHALVARLARRARDAAGRDGRRPARPSPFRPAAYRARKTGPTGVSAMPSPRWPRRCNGELLSHARPRAGIRHCRRRRDRRGDNVRGRASRARQRRPKYRRTPRRARRRRARCPFLTAARPASNCGLISAISCAGSFANASAAGRTNLSEMKLTSTTTKSGARVEAGRGERADVGFLQRNDLGALAQRFMQLPASDIDRVDVPGAALQQHLRESAGGGADIEANAAARIEAEMIERRRELHPAARDVRMRRCRAQARIHRDCPPTPCAQ